MNISLKHDLDSTVLTTNAPLSVLKDAWLH